MSPHPELLSVRITGQAPEAIVTVRGELDPHTALGLESTLRDVGANQEVRRLVVDLSGVGFIDSSGLRVLLAAHADQQADGGRLVLRAPSDGVRRLLEMTDLVAYLDVE